MHPKAKLLLFLKYTLKLILSPTPCTLLRLRMLVNSLPQCQCIVDCANAQVMCFGLSQPVKLIVKLNYYYYR